MTIISSDDDDDKDSDIIVLPESTVKNDIACLMDVEDEVSGNHVNDALNQPDSLGRVLVNVGHSPSEPDIFLAPQLSAAVKPHQVMFCSFTAVNNLHFDLIKTLKLLIVYHCVY